MKATCNSCLCCTVELVCAAQCRYKLHDLCNVVSDINFNMSWNTASNVIVVGSVVYLNCTVSGYYLPYMLTVGIPSINMSLTDQSGNVINYTIVDPFVNNTMLQTLITANEQGGATRQYFCNVNFSSAGAIQSKSEALSFQVHPYRKYEFSAN